MCGEGNGSNGHGERKLVTCVGKLAFRVPKLSVGSFSPTTCRRTGTTKFLAHFLTGWG